MANVIEKIQKYHEMANVLGNTADSYQLYQLMMRVKNNNFLIPVLGYGSAHKSEFLNELFERKVVPIYKNGVTKYTTYIYYSDDESVKVFDRVGRSLEISFEQFQNIEEGLELPFEISNIEVGIQSDLLKKGLVLSDIPDLEQDIKENQELTNNILTISQYVICVLNGAMDNNEINLLKSMYEYNVQTIFVRSEEINIEGKIKNRVYNDVSILSDTRYNYKYYVMTKNQSQFKKLKYSEDIFTFEKYIAEDLPETIQMFFKELIDLMVEEYTVEYKVQLGSKIALLDKVADSSIMQLEDMIEYLNDEMDEMYGNTRNFMGKVQEAAQNSVVEINNTVGEMIDLEVNKIDEIVKGTQNYAELNKKMEEYNSVVIKDFIESINNLYMSSLIAICRQVDSIYKARLEQLEDDMRDKINLNYKTTSFNVERHEEKNHYYGQLLKRELVMIENYLNNADPIMQEYHVEEKDLIEYLDYIKTCVRGELYDLRSIGEIEGALIVSKPETLKAINVLLSEGLAAISAESQMQILSKVTKTIIGAKVAPILSKTDGIKDVIFSVKKINPVSKIVNDWYSTSDTSFGIKVEVDSDDGYFQERMRIENAIYDKYNKIIEVDMSKMMKSGILKSETMKEKYESDLQKKYSKKMSSEIEKALKSIKVKSNGNNDGWEKYRQSYSDNCKEIFQKREKLIHENNIVFYNQELEYHIKKSEAQFFSKMHSIENEIDEILEYREKDPARMIALREKAVQLLKEL